MSKNNNPPVSADVGTYETLEFEDIGLHHPRVVGEGNDRFLILATYLEHIVSRIEGVVLTMVESSTSDKEKREATKSIIKRLIWDEVDKIRLLKLKKIK